MVRAIIKMFKRKKLDEFNLSDKEFEELGLKLKKEIDTIFGRSIAIRELDAGSDNTPEIELNQLAMPPYDIERFGISVVASPRHADVIVVTGAITHNMEIAAKKTYDAAPFPKYVVAIGDDACDGGIFKGTYAVLGGADKVLPVDVKIHGDPPTPKEILKGLLALMRKIREQKK